MRKFLVITLALVIASFSANAFAYDGDFEMAGHINTGMGWVYQGSSLAGATGGIFVEENMVPPDINTLASGKLSNKSTWLFYVGDVELDIMKTFGENIRLRADIDFLRAGSNGFHNGFQLNNMIEQAYVTVNIPVGYGMEFLVGRFNAPMGFEAVDNNDNDLPFHTLVYNYIRPHNLTGAKFYYPFSDLIDLHVWISNNLRDAQGGGVQQSGPIPAFGGRLGFTWGMEGQESTLGLSGVASSEVNHNVVGVVAVDNDKYGDWTYIADIDFNVWVNDVFAIGGEGIFRRDGASQAAKAVGGRNNWYYGGLLNMHYVFSDVWDGTLRYTYVHDVNGSPFNPNGIGPGASTLSLAPGVTGVAYNQLQRYLGSATGVDAQWHQIDLGINYNITDGAKLMAMYRFEMILPDKGGLPKTYPNGNKNGFTHSVAANFAYEF